MKTKITVDPELAYKISHLYSEGYTTGQIANMQHIPEFKVIDILQFDAAQRRTERTFYNYRRY